MIKWCVRHREIVFLLGAFLFILGVFVYPQMERQENPDVTVPMATVKCVYPGAEPEDVERLVAKPLEEHINEITEIKTLESFSMDSAAFFKIKLKDLSDRQINEVWQKLRDKVDDAKPELPAEAWEPEVNTEYSDTYGLMLGLTGEAYSYATLKKTAKRLKDLLRDDPGVKTADLDGAVAEEIVIALDPVKLEQYQIAPLTIVKLLKARNVNIPGGNLEIGNLKVPVQTSGEYENIEEIRNTVVDISASGNPVYLKDLAVINRGEQKSEVLARLNNQKAVLVAVKFAERINVLKVRQRLAKLIAGFEKNGLKPGMRLTVVTDQTKFVKESIGLFEQNLLEAIILVVLVIMAAMGLRSSMVVSLTIPAVMMSVFIYMQMAGIPLHQVSIAALIVSLSMLVANGIVANDSIYLYLQKGLDRETACVRGTNEVRVAILTSTLTSIASFLPLAMMQGTSGKFVKSLPVLVSVALFSSYILALTLVPATAFSILKVRTTAKRNSLLKHIKRFFKIDLLSDRLKQAYHRLLTASLKKPRLIIMVSLLVFSCSLTLVPALGVQLFPYVERDQYVINIDLREGSTVTATDKTARQVTKLLLEDRSVQLVMTKVGDGPLRFYTTFTGNNISGNKAQLIVNGDRQAMGRLETMLNERISDARITFKRLENAAPVEFPVEIRVSGASIGKLKLIAEEIKTRIAAAPEVKNLQDNYGLDSYKLKVKVNEEKANLVGLSNYDIATTVRLAINGLEITRMKQKDIDDDDLPVVLKIPEAEKHRKEIVDRLYFTSQLTGANIPLGQVAEVHNQFALNRIVRRDLNRTITVGMFVQDGYNANELQKNLANILNNYRLPAGYHLEFGGESEERADAFTSMVVPSILAIIIIYLILVFQFGNLVDPLIIMGTIPLSFIGIILGLKLTGFPIGFMALLGAISLMGVVVNNGIVLLDYIKILFEEGADLQQAVVTGCVTRSRPIIIGMVTTVISLLPLGLSGGSLWAPLAYSIIFGMLVSTILTLLVIPVIFYMLKQKRANSPSVKAAGVRSI